MSAEEMPYGAGLQKPPLQLLGLIPHCFGHDSIRLADQTAFALLAANNT
jgi:hypothetical protein